MKPFVLGGDYCPASICSWEAVAGPAIAGVLGAGLNAFGASSAASAQGKAADKAIQAQMLMLERAFAIQQGNMDRAIQLTQQAQELAKSTENEYLGMSTGYQEDKLGRANDFEQHFLNSAVGALTPYSAAGRSAVNQLMERLPQLTSPITMDQATLEKTPGYQFIRDQGLRAAQQSATVRGLGLSGAQIKGAEAFATDLANTTYKDQFNLENINRTNAFNRLLQTVGMGQQADSQVAALEGATGANFAGRQMQTGSQVGSQIAGAGQQLTGGNLNMGAILAQILGGQGNAMVNALMQTGQGIAGAEIGKGDAQAAMWNSMTGGFGNALTTAGNAYTQNLLMSKLFNGMFSGAKPQVSALAS